MSEHLEHLIRQRDPLWIPLYFRLAAKLEQMMWDELTEEAGNVVFALRGCRRLLRADAFAAWFDPWLEAEALGVRVERDKWGTVLSADVGVGAPPKVSDWLNSDLLVMAIEVARRLCLETRQQSVLGYLTGPETMARHWRRDPAPSFAELAEYAVPLANAWADAGVGGLLLAEERVTRVDWLAAYEPLFNIARYYNLPVVFVTGGPLAIEQGSALRSAGVAFCSAWPDGTDDRVQTIPLAALSVESTPALSTPTPQLVLSQWEIDPQTAPERLLAVAQMVRPF